MQAKDKTKLTFEKANALLRYYPDTGLLYWKVAKGVRRAGDIAGRKDALHPFAMRKNLGSSQQP
jgi:hypothetical protein